MGNVRENLIKARKLISNADNWCKNYFTGPNDSYCAIGAIVKVHGIPMDELTYSAIGHLDEVAVLMRTLNTQSIVAVGQYNDGGTHDRVMQLFDKAIASLGPEVSEYSFSGLMIHLKQGTLTPVEMEV